VLFLGWGGGRGGLVFFLHLFIYRSWISIRLQMSLLLIYRTWLSLVLFIWWKYKYEKYLNYVGFRFQFVMKWVMTGEVNFQHETWKSAIYKFMTCLIVWVKLYDTTCPIAELELWKQPLYLPVTVTCLTCKWMQLTTMSNLINGIIYIISYITTTIRLSDIL